MEKVPIFLNQNQGGRLNPRLSNFPSFDENEDVMTQYLTQVNKVLYEILGLFQKDLIGMWNQTFRVAFFSNQISYTIKA